MDRYNEFNPVLNSVAQSIGGIYDRKKKTVRVSYGYWDIVFKQDKRDSYYITSIRTVYLYNSDLKFSVVKREFSHKLFRLRGIKTGNSDFDNFCYIKGNDTLKIKDIFKYEEIQLLLMRVFRFCPQSYLKIGARKIFIWNRRPKGLDELIFVSMDYVNREDLIKDFFCIIKRIIDALVKSNLMIAQRPNYKIA